MNQNKSLRLISHAVTASCVTFLLLAAASAQNSAPFAPAPSNGPSGLLPRATPPLPQTSAPGSQASMPPKRPAYGRLEFGERSDEATKIFFKEIGADREKLQDRQGVERNATAEILMKKLMGPSAAVFPPKLSDKFKKVHYTCMLRGSPFLYSLEISAVPANQQTSTPEESRLAWDVFYDIACAKFGAPVHKADFTLDVKESYLVTDEWKVNGGSLLQLVVRNDKYVLFLVTDPEWEAYSKGTAPAK